MGSHHVDLAGEAEETALDQGIATTLQDIRGETAARFVQGLATICRFLPCTLHSVPGSLDII